MHLHGLFPNLGLLQVLQQLLLALQCGPQAWKQGHSKLDLTVLQVGCLMGVVGVVRHTILGHSLIKFDCL